MFQKTVEKERKNSKLSKQQAEKINSAPLKNVHHAVLAIQLRVKLPEVDRSKGDPQNILFEILSTTNSEIIMAHFFNIIQEINFLYVLNH